MACRASSTLVGRAYPNGAGIMARLLRRLGRSPVTSEGGLGGGDAGGGLGLRPTPGVGAGGGAGAPLPPLVQRPPDPFRGQRPTEFGDAAGAGGVQRGAHHGGGGSRGARA